MTPVWRLAGLLPPVGVAVFAAIEVPTAAIDWVRACVILAAAIVTTELVRRTQTVRRNEFTMTSVWSVAAAVSVHLTLALALVLAVCAYRYLRGNHEFTIAWPLVAAHFAASSGAWAIPTLQANTTRVVAVAAAAATHLIVNYALATIGRVLRDRRVSRTSFGHIADIGLDAALLTVGAVTGVLMTGTPVVVLATIPVVVMLYSAATTKQLEGTAFVDQKTGLANAASWQAYAERVIADVAQDRREVGILMVDLDKFKRLNDTYGHRAGDDVLAAVGECLKSNLRQADLGGRFGGEEFTVLLPETNVVDTIAIAERIRTAIAALHITTVDKNGVQTVISDVTASIGAATYPHHGATVQDCLRVADNYVYQAKHQGRNTVAGISTENIVSIRA
ncbi:diguanylate cyclase (GGDEF)-like protein [Kibdelosporangium banguiense]|uniref:Diguanylate cyclase (GGDEF)-like protein n=1 Tax=Kibdelosporangium banguiense TaxID=1365924 RepID=A0ABS4TKB0_9PSEU|nr:diguanylate cyclase [Kibdelosporangium banguiense]MBP2324852.1 diguanylate cyclase (GGDEF)-like protein [Kibdelosporangium banguiense]